MVSQSLDPNVMDFFSEMTKGDDNSASINWRADQSIAPPFFHHLVTDDPYLVPYEGDFRYRYTEFKKSLDAIEADEGSILKFA